ncbi:MAG: hypothetical protein HY303_04625 [Candidatus Wallbacteria bacterium]|nr:hypothetical protein [Candidatus Wallbacteria bacterium]
MKLPDALKSQQERIVQAVADEAEGRGPLEELLRHPGVVAVYAVSPADVFAATPPSELIDPAPSVSGVPTPEGYQRTRVRFRDVEHMRRTASRLLAPLAQDLTPATPAVEGTLPDGWAVGAQIMEGGGAAILMQRSQ